MLRLPDCTESASHRAPKGRNREREYWRFCLHHVREYNQSYNFFAGMSDDAVARFQKDALTGHLPTWRIGMIGGKGRAKGKAGRPFDEGFGSEDPFDILRGVRRSARRCGTIPRRGRAAHRAQCERKALHALGLEDGAASPTSRRDSRKLVKRHHPDANGGDRSSEDKLRGSSRP